MDSRQYEDEVAGFFASLGLNAQPRAVVRGARAEHRVDVWVTYVEYGIEHRWVIECKNWNRNVEKEKVLALHEVVSDVGATMGFLITEIGFQPGALTAASQTNLILTTFAELKARIGKPTLRLVAGELLTIDLFGPRRKMKVLALPDSAAGISAAPLEVGKALGFDFGKARQLTLGFPAGSLSGFETDVTMKLSDAPDSQCWQAPVAFLDGFDIILVLGRRGFFDRFAIRYDPLLQSHE